MMYSCHPHFYLIQHIFVESVYKAKTLKPVIFQQSTFFRDDIIKIFIMSSVDFMKDTNSHTYS